VTHPHESAPTERAARKELLTALLQRTAPLPQISAQLAGLPCDSDPVVELTDEHLLAALGEYLDGTFDAASIEQWADAVELRDDIEFSRNVHLEIVFELATPYTAGPLTPAVARDMHQRLGRDAR
jgi:hypothetical protein